MNSSGSITSPESISSSGPLGSARSWIFGGLTLAGAGLMLYTWFQPWWVAYIEALLQNGVIIYPYAMVFNGTLLDYPQWLIGAEMPAWFFPLMWVYLGACLLALFMSLFYSEEWIGLGKLKLPLSQVLIGFAGLAYVIFVVVFPIVVSIRAPQFHGVPLQGNTFISMDEHTESYVITSLQNGYWLACCTAGFLVALSLLRSIIIGQPSNDANV